ALRTLSSAFGNSHGDPGVGRAPDVPPPGPRPLPGLSDVRSAGNGSPISGEPDDGGEPGAGTEPGAGGPPKAA
ncbi:MAG: hypothetical protein ACLP70_21240, partial [Streptosporangiaceae bacterium]